MGSFGSAIGDLARAGADEFSEALEHGKVHVQAATDALSSQEHVFNQTKAGSLIGERIKNLGIPTRAAVTEKILKHETQLRTPHPTDPTLNKLGTPLVKDPVDIGKAITDGNKAGRYAALGLNDGFGVTAAAHIHQTEGLASAESFSNAIALVFKDYVNPLAHREGELPTKEEIASAAKRGKKPEAPFSTFKKRVYNAGVPLSDVKPAYIPHTGVERAVASTAYSTFSPLMVIPHLMTLFNGALGSDPITFLRGITKPIGKSLDESMDKLQTLTQSGSFVEKYMRDARDINRYMATGHPEFTGSGAAKYVVKMFHNPGFAPWRDYNLVSAANVGLDTMHDLGQELARKGAKPNLMYQAAQLGLDPHKIIANGGILDQDDISRGVYRFVNEHYFLDNSLNRSRFLQGSPYGRILGMYHGYVTRQSQLMRRALMTGYKVNGAAGVVKNLAIIGALMPMGGEAVKIFQESYRGQNAGGDLKKDIESIEGEHGTRAWTEAYLGGLSHAAAFGVYAHFLRGALVHNLAGTIGGPIVSSVTDLAQDTIGATNKSWNRVGTNKKLIKGKDWKPVGRDLEYDTPGISLLAQFLSHRLTPNAKDKPYNDPARQFLYKAEGKDKFGHTQDELKDKSDSHQNMFTN